MSSCVRVGVCALCGLTLVLFDFRYPANSKKLMLQTEESRVRVVLPDLKPLPSLLCDVSDMATGVCVCGCVGEMGNGDLSAGLASAWCMGGVSIRVNTTIFTYVYIYICIHICVYIYTYTYIYI